MSPATVVAISTSRNFSQRVAKMAVNEGHTIIQFETVDQLMDDTIHNLLKTEFLMIDATTAVIENDIVGMVQVGKQFCPRAFLMAVVGSKTRPEVALFVKKSGANAVLLEQEFLNLSKPEYIWAQAVKSPYLPVKVSDFKVGTKLDHDIFHYMPMNRKFITVVPKGLEIAASKFEKMRDVGEFYIDKKDLDVFIDYSNQHVDNSADGLAQRCRAQFQKLSLAFSHLVLLLSDQSESASFSEGKILYEACLKCTDELLGNLAAANDPWNIVDNAAFGAHGSVDRAASVAAYAGLLSLKSGLGTTSDCMVGALMANIGMLDLSPSTTFKLRHQNINQLNAEEKNEFEKHMVFSLNQCLSRRVPLTESMKNIILCTHEQANGEGFPNRPRADKIPTESYIIHFCELLDGLTIIQEGQLRPEIKTVKIELWNRMKSELALFPDSFLNKLKATLLE